MLVLTEPYTPWDGRGYQYDSHTVQFWMLSADEQKKDDFNVWTAMDNYGNTSIEQP